MKKKLIASILVIGLLLSATPLSISGKEASNGLSHDHGNSISCVSLNDYEDPYNKLDTMVNQFDLPIDFELPNIIPGELIVKFKDDIDLSSSSPDGMLVTGIESVDALNRKFSVTSAEELIEQDPDPEWSNIYKLTLPSNSDILFAAEEYKNDLSIEFAEPNYIVQFYSIPNDEYFDMQWALHNTGQNNGTTNADIDAPEAWDITSGDDDIVIAILDTGVDYTHPELTTNIWTNHGEDAWSDPYDPETGNKADDDGNGYIDDWKGWNFQDNNNDPMDDFGHGTHCAGIAAAVTNNNIGVSGVAGNCKIMPLELGAVDSAAKAIKYAVDNGADIISMSFGVLPLFEFNGSTLFDLALTYADLRGVVLIAAAGDTPWSIPSSPASHDKVLAVAATDNNDTKASFSSFGLWIDVAAPGCDILSLRADGTDMYLGSEGYQPGQYFVPPFDPDAILYRAWGTSMSCPIVAGVAALVLSQKPGLTSREVRTILRSSTDPVTSDKYIGLGRINAYEAVQKAEHVVAELDDSLDHEFLEGITKIKGTAKGITFQEYVVEYGKGIYPDDSSWIEIGGSDKRKYGGTLVSWDTTQVEDGPYALRLRVTTSDHIYYEDRTFVIVDNIANTYHVDDALDSGDGSLEHPFNKIQTAIDLSGCKDTVYVHRGTYSEPVGIEHRSITMIGEDRDETIIKVGISVIRGSLCMKNFTMREHGVSCLFSSNNVISENTFTDSDFISSIGFLVSSNNVITNNFITNPPKNGSDIGFTILSNDNIISGNTIINNGILFMLGAKRNIISDNIANHIALVIACHNNDIYDNIISTGRNFGIYLCNGWFNKIYNNIISDIKIEDPYASCGIKVEPDHFLLAGIVGPDIGDSLFNEITSNIISNCDYGIYMRAAFVHNEQSNPTLDEVVNCKFNKISKNDISDTEVGILLDGACKNKISKNTLSDNNYGIYLKPWVEESYQWNADSNKIYYNNFINNSQHAYDECDNNWYRPLLMLGNYWDDYEDKYPDAEPRSLMPWIWDTPYDINGSDNQDKYPLVNPYAENNNPPDKPDKPSGPTSVYRFVPSFYSTTTDDSDGNFVYYKWDWGDGSFDTWYLVPRLDFFPTIRAHIWLKPGEYEVKVKSKDIWGYESDWSEPLTVTVKKWFDWDDDYDWGDNSCFLAGTKVTMADGSYKNIEDIELGNIVKSYDMNTGELVDAEVTTVYHHTPEEMPDYYVVINDQIRATPNHFFFINGEPMPAGELQVGDLLTSSSGSDVVIESIEQVFDQVPTYNFEVSTDGGLTSFSSYVISFMSKSSSSPEIEELPASKPAYSSQQNSNFQQFQNNQQNIQSNDNQQSQQSSPSE